MVDGEREDTALPGPVIGPLGQSRPSFLAAGYHQAGKALGVPIYELLGGLCRNPDAAIFVNGRRGDGAITCTRGGALPSCDEEKITITLDAAPPAANPTCPCPELFPHGRFFPAGAKF